MKSLSRRLAALVLAAGTWPAANAQAPSSDVPPAPSSGDAVTRSALDAPLFYQLLIGEMELRAGEAGTAYQIMLDAARRTNDDTLFRRAVEIALHARAGEQALSAARTWHEARPTSDEALRYRVQLLVALNRTAESVEPLRALLAAASDAERPALIASLPRLFQRSNDRRAAAQALEQVLRSHVDATATRTPARVALGRAWLAAGDAARALALADRAHADDLAAPGPALLAIDMLPGTPAAERLVTAYLAQPKAETMVRLSYVRLLTSSQRYADAAQQLELVTQERPELAPPWLSLGALRLELKRPEAAESALHRYVELAQAGKPDSNDGFDEETAGDRGLMQAWLLLAQAAEQRGDFPAAERWLSRVDNPQRALEVQTRRATILARQGQIAQARALIHRVPERAPGDARAKLLAEAQVMREVKRWRDAHDVLAAANKKFSNDIDLLYEQAMAAEKLDRMSDMERLLREVIALKPDHHHAYNALGYSLADRNLRLVEARELIRKALELAPGDPFITDSMGWVEYRLGNHAEALRHLRMAYGSRPDTEIAAHLGEVLWVDGQHDEARRVLRDARGRDEGNEVLRETLARLKVDL